MNKRIPSIRSAIFVLAYLLACACLTAVLAADKPAATVRMTAQMTFEPQTVTIYAGQTVEWIAEDTLHEHSISTDKSKVNDPDNVSIPKGAKPFNTPLIEPGKTYEQTFTVPGVYKYACPPHEMAHMVGEVIVKPR